MTTLLVSAGGADAEGVDVVLVTTEPSEPDDDEEADRLTGYATWSCRGGVEVEVEAAVV